MAIDLSNAINCIDVMKRDSVYRGHKIGIIKGSNPDSDNYSDKGLSSHSHYSNGDVVLFREDLHPSNSQITMGEYRDLKQTPTGKVTIEFPLTPERIAEQRAKGSLISVMGTMINVPAKYVEEVII